MVLKTVAYCLRITLDMNVSWCDNMHETIQLVSLKPAGLNDIETDKKAETKTKENDEQNNP